MKNISDAKVVVLYLLQQNIINRIVMNVLKNVNKIKFMII